MDNMEEEKKNKIWTDENGITHMKIIRLVDEEDLSSLIEDLKESLRGFLGKPKILVDIKNIEDKAATSSSWFRKKAVRQGIDFVQSIGFEKVAVFGTSIEDRTAASFVIAAVRIKNIKIFVTEEEALKWLKES